MSGSNGDAKRRPHVLKIRLSEQELAKIKAAAGLSRMATFIRDAALGRGDGAPAVAMISPTDAAAIVRTLSPIGASLREIEGRIVIEHKSDADVAKAVIEARSILLDVLRVFADLDRSRRWRS